MTTREVFDEKVENGLIVSGTYLPEELLAEILCYVDYSSLSKCRLVCKRWKDLTETYVWRKKAEISLGRSLLFRTEVPWYFYYLICVKKPFERNLIKNHSGEEGTESHWDTVTQGENWKVENPPLGVPLLPNNEPVLEGKQYCFVTSFRLCIKRQVIRLEEEGLLPCILDELQPPIVVSEWYSCRWDCPAKFKCTVTLIGENNTIMEFFNFNENIEGEKQNRWHYVSHEFKNYGPGLREIAFCHGGTDQSFWAGHYGSKMAGACVYVKIPTTKPSKGDIATISLDLD